MPVSLKTTIELRETEIHELIRRLYEQVIDNDGDCSKLSSWMADDLDKLAQKIRDFYARTR